jgi:plasmid maintenance system killer protein
MRAVFTEAFSAAFIGAPSEVHKVFGKPLANLLRDLRHPSLRAKRYDERRGLWQARVNDDWRFYFTIEGDAYILRAITPHPK